MEKNLNINIIQGEQPQQPLAMHPKKFIVWLFIVSIVMMFAGWTSSYIVAKADGAVSSVVLPSIFTTSTILLLLSSVTMHLAYRSSKKDNLAQLKIFTSLTFLLGVVFLVLQLQGFGKLAEYEIEWVGGSVIDSFSYLLPGMHGLHIVAGLIFLLIVLVKAFRYKVHSKNMVSMEMCATFWHFLDGLWLYLFFFLQFN